MSSIRISRACRSYGSVQAVNDVTLDIQDGEFFTLLGPSGCGKTTLLRSIAGLERLDSGQILVGDQDLGPVPVHRRSLGMVFQNLALFPHMNVNQNVAYGMRARGVSRAESRARTVDALDMVALGGLGRRQVAELSGGQQQRVALARALVTEPRVLLLDEPLSALDLQLRQQMQVELKKLQQRVGTTFVFVTHDQDEAMAMSDRIAVLNGGQVEQVGTPNELYQRPASRFVADFVGDSNLLDGVADAQDGKTTLVGAGLSAYLPRSIPPGQQVTLCVRPESISVNAAAPDHDCRVRGLISASVYRGSSVRLFVASEAGFEFLADVATTHAGVPVGSTVELSWRSRDSWAVTENVPSDDEMAPY